MAKTFTILGAGIAGISASYHLKINEINSIVYEKNNSWGGHCDNFVIDGFRFDYCVHLSFTKNEYVKELFSKSAEFNTLIPIPYNYYNGYWLKHPVQNNLFPLPVTEKILAIKDFIDKPKLSKVKNYEDWLYTQYGKYIAKNFPIRYTQKYWTKEAKELSIDWLGERMYIPSLDEILEGAFTSETPITYYAKEMRYPKYGGFKAFINSMAQYCDIEYNKEIKEINTKTKQISFANGTKTYYEYLISSLPLPILINSITNVPKKIKEAAESLFATSVALVSVGFKRPDVAQHLWFYIYDENILPSRAYSPSLKSKNNVPIGKSSYQFETYYSTFKKLKMSDDNLINHVVESGIKMNLFSNDDIEIVDFKNVEYGNVIFDFNTIKAREIIKRWLDDNNIKSIGRYGEWDYFWSDQSLLSGKNAITEFINK